MMQKLDRRSFMAWRKMNHDVSPASINIYDKLIYQNDGWLSRHGFPSGAWYVSYFVIYIVPIDFSLAVKYLGTNTILLNTQLSTTYKKYFINSFSKIKVA